MKLNKKVKGEEFWPRLMKDKVLEKNTVTLDWDRCVQYSVSSAVHFTFALLSVVSYGLFASNEEC
jgi:hypothetical protein